MRKFILIAGLVLASAAAQAGDRGLSLAQSETTAVTAPARVNHAQKTAEAPPVVEAPKEVLKEAPKAEAPKYIERPAVVEPRLETNKPDAIKAPAAKVEQPAAEPAKPVAKKASSSSRNAKPRGSRYWTEARIIRELNRHGIYW
jgi:outer membrane biosynthesis protein TonB